MTTVALVAAKDAEGSIEATVAALRSLRDVDEVWVVDDGSTDATAKRAEDAGARVVRLDENRGKGGALTVGVAATPHAHRYLLADADLGATAVGLAPLLDCHDGLVVGVLPSAGTRGGFGSVKRLARAGIRRACGLSLDAPLSGQRLVDGELLRAMALAPRFGVEVGMTIDAARAGVEAREVPVDVDHRHTGRTVAGFRHRARQGADIVAALLPRLTTTRQRTASVIAVALVAVLALSALSWLRAAPPGRSFATADRVVLFAFDQLELSDLKGPDTPALQALADTAATGALSVRTSDRRSLARRFGPERPSALDAYASLGASARVRGVDGLGHDPAAGAQRAMAVARTLARRDKAAALPGGLGDALHRAGRRTGLVAGPQFVDGPDVVGIPGAAALADRAGRIDVVDVSAGLLEPVTASGTPRASIAAFGRATASALDRSDVVLVDAGETARAADTGAGRAAAVARTDEILAAVRAVLPPRTLLVVFSPTPADDDWALTPLVLHDASTERGLVASSATHRRALAVLTDIAPTVLHALGVPADTDMTGAVLRHAEGDFEEAAFARLEADGAVRNRFFLGAAIGYTVAALAFYVVLIAALLLGGARRWSRPLRAGACIAGAFPFALLVTGAVQHWLRFGGESPALLVATCVLLGAVGTRVRGLAAIYGFAAASVIVTAIDVAATGPIHTASLLGYTLQTTGRFYGLPNASFAVFASSLVLTAVAVAGGLRPATPVRLAAAAGVLLGGLVFVAAPWLGNDVGGTLALTPVSLALLWAFAGRAFTRRAVGRGLVAVAVTLALGLGAEALVADGGHLARFVSGSSPLTALRHRADVNVGLLVDQWWGFLVFALAGVGLLGAARGAAVEEAPFGSPLRAGVVGVIVLSLLAFVANDSGPVVSVLCLVVVAPALALRATDVSRLRRSRR